WHMTEPRMFQPQNDCRLTPHVLDRGCSILPKGIVVADKAAETRHLVVEGAGTGVVLLGLPIIAHRPALPRGIGHGVDQPAGRALSSYGLVDEQILQIATIVAPNAGMEQVVRDPDQLATQLAIEASAQTVDFPILQQTIPGAIVVAVRQLGFVEVVVATRQLLPGRA